MDATRVSHLLSPGDLRRHVSTERLTLPKLLYIGDVPVEATYHGSALLYRLLEKYVPAGLTIVETGMPSAVDRRLPSAEYIWSGLAKARWMNTRFHPYAVAFYSAAAMRVDSQVLASLKNVEFDSVLTVVHGFGWLTAARLAESRDVPLHLMIHDDWPRVAQVPKAFRHWLDRRFGEVYRQADSRMCVSPAMRDAYRRSYGKDAEVIYPLRDRRSENPIHGCSSLSREGFTLAFAGSVNTPAYAEALRTLSQALQSVDGRLLVFGPLNRSDAAKLKLDSSNITLCGLVDSFHLIERLREEADALFVPMSFEEADRLNMERAFPSKLADYTAVGAPLLIYGPPYCSAVRWAEASSGVAEVVTTKGLVALTKALDRLASSPSYCDALGQRALLAGGECFSHESAQSAFDRSLMNSIPMPRTVAATSAAT